MKGLKFLVTFMTVLCFAGTAFAASGNQVDMKTDIPTIPISACDRAGFVSFEMGDGFQMTEGDQIQLNLTNLVTACKELDYFLVMATTDAQTYPLPTVAGEPVTSTDPGATLIVNQLDTNGGASAPGLVAGEAIGFLVQANEDASRVRLTLARIVLATGEVSVVNDADLSYQITLATTPVDELAIRFFDLKNKDAEVAPGVGAYFLKDDPTTDIPDDVAFVDYLEAIDPEDNTLCIDTSDPDVIFSDGQYVRATPQSIPTTIADPVGGGNLPQTPITFSGDNTVATISGSTGYTIEAVGKGTCPTVTILPTTNQFGEEVGNEVQFDMGDYGDAACPDSRWSLDGGQGVCVDDVNNNDASGRGILISRTNAFDATEEFRVTVSLAILADGATDYVDAPASVAWFGSALHDAYFTAAGEAGNTDCLADAIDTAGQPFSAFEDDEVGDEVRVISQRTGYIIPGDPAAPGLDSDRDAIMVDPRAFNFDKQQMDAGDALYLKVTIEEFPCGVVATGYVCVFIAAECEVDAAAAVGNDLLFPYGVGANNAAFWTGIAVTNLTNTMGTATVTFYGTDGGQSTYDVEVPAFGITSFAMSAIMDMLDGTLTGDENFFAIVDAPFTADGIMFVGGKGANTVLHGYLPRVQ